jgi:glycosyltransferase involved in cell wall biosynthesis
MTTRLDVTVIVPAYDAGRFIAQTLETVITQTAQPFEVLIVDDGSADATCDVVESFARAHPGCPVRLLREPHRGPGAARNAGVRAARTEWVSFLDSDDLWQPEKLATVIAAINEHPDANFFCHNETVRFLDGRERVTNHAANFSYEKPVPPQLYRQNFFSTSAVVCRRDLVLRWKGFDEGLTSAQDYELWLRMSPDLRPVFVSEALGTYVLRSGNITTTRFWRRLRNAISVKRRHRQKVGVGRYVYETSRVITLQLGGPARAFAMRLLKRGT